MAGGSIAVRRYSAVDTFGVRVVIPRMHPILKIFFTLENGAGPPLKKYQETDDSALARTLLSLGASAARRPFPPKVRAALFLFVRDSPPRVIRL